MKSICYFNIGGRDEQLVIDINIDVDQLKRDIDYQVGMDCDDGYLSDVFLLENKHGKFIIGEEEEYAYIIGGDDSDINNLIDIFGSYTKSRLDFDIDIGMVKHNVINGMFNWYMLDAE